MRGEGSSSEQCKDQSLPSKRPELVRCNFPEQQQAVRSFPFVARCTSAGTTVDPVDLADHPGSIELAQGRTSNWKFELWLDH